MQARWILPLVDEGVEMSMRRWIAGVLFTSVWLVGGGVVRAAPPKLTASERSRLESWKSVVRVDKSSPYWVPTAMLLFSVRPEQIMSVVMDISKYDKYMPKVKQSRVVRRRGRNTIWAVIVTSLPWPLRNAWVAVRYTWSLLGAHSYRLAWVRERGSMRRYWGRLDLYPWGKYWTLAVCTMQAEPDENISRSRLNGGIVWGTEQLLQHLRQRVDSMIRLGVLGWWQP